jgi:hypothetical protein
MKKSKFWDFFGIWNIWPISPQISILYVQTGRYLFKSEIVLIVSSCATLMPRDFRQCLISDMTAYIYAPKQNIFQNASSL